MGDQHEELEDRFLDIHEAAHILEISEEELWGLVRKNEIPHHNLAGAFLRFKKRDVEELKIRWRIARELFPPKQEVVHHAVSVPKAGALDRLKDLWYFNDYYVFCFTLMVLLLYVIISSQ